MQIPSEPGTFHIVGIGGIGMSAIAEILRAKGHTVQGSDLKDSANLERLRKRLRRSPMIEIPQLDADVHDLHGLRLMDEYLFG